MWDVIRYQNMLAQVYSAGPSKSMTEQLEYFTPPPDGYEILSMILNLIILFILLFTVGFLTLQQLYYAASNVTTVESFENSKMEELRKKGKLPLDKFTFPFDLGWHRNFQVLFGETPLLWWLPKKASGNGIDWEMNQEDSLEWPPREYFYLKKNPNASFGEKDRVLRKKYGAHVRRGSEGYLVKEITPEDRERMLGQAEEKAAHEEEPIIEFDSEFDSMDEVEEEEQESQAKPTSVMSQPSELLTQDSDDEILDLRRRNLNKS